MQLAFFCAMGGQLAFPNEGEGDFAGNWQFPAAWQKGCRQRPLRSACREIGISGGKPVAMRVTAVSGNWGNWGEIAISHHQQSRMDGGKLTPLPTGGSNFPQPDARSFNKTKPAVGGEDDNTGTNGNIGPRRPSQSENVLDAEKYARHVRARTTLALLACDITVRALMGVPTTSCRRVSQTRFRRGQTRSDEVGCFPAGNTIKPHIAGSFPAVRARGAPANTSVRYLCNSPTRTRTPEYLSAFPLLQTLRIAHASRASRA